MVNKQVLRQVYLEKRLFLSEEEYAIRNRLLHAQFASYSQDKSWHHAHTFLPMPKKKEVNTWPLIDFLRTNLPHVQIYTSRTVQNNRLEHYELYPHTKLRESRWGIPEPVECTPSVPEGLDLILVPLISFDRIGHRIGYGKGYYDRFLKDYPHALKAGVSLGPPLDRIEYVNKFDVPLDVCFTPYQIYQF